MNDLDLLRLYEPVVKYTQGELFFPCAVESYLPQCSLWERDTDGKSTLLIEEGVLTRELLARYDQAPPGHTYYLRYVNQPLTGLEYQRWQRSDLRPRFVTRGRLSRVGLLARIIDSFFDLSLLVRGRVPGGTTAAAHLKYLQLRAEDPRYVYYSRVIREGGYIILHYLYFSVMNNWRSTFFGVNDHEGDWEQVLVFLSDDNDGDPVPRWVSYAAHDKSGDEMRRRWDDPALEIHDGTHPIVYSGAGSHASYIEPGEYLTRVTIPALVPVRQLAEELRTFWNERLRQGDTVLEAGEVSDFLSVPFVDYARGDGLVIGAGQSAGWTPILINDDTPWVKNYRGLWGLDTRDFFGGERAPAGPRYTRDGRVRRTWHNPLGWAGLNKVAPPNVAIEDLRGHIINLQAEIDDTTSRIMQERESVRLLDLEVTALRQTDHTVAFVNSRVDQLETREAALNGLYEHAARLEETLEAAQRHLERLENGDLGDPRAHLKTVVKPEPEYEAAGRVVEFWAAVSTALFLVLFIGSLILDPSNWLERAGLIILAFITIETTLRGGLIRWLLNVVLVMAVFSALVLAVEFITWLALGLLLFLARLLITSNLREFFE